MKNRRITTCRGAFESARTAAAMLAAALVFFLPISCSRQPQGPSETILYDFEKDADLDQLNWKCFTLFSLSELHAAHGRRSLKLELYPSSWPGWGSNPGVSNWDGYRRLCFDIYNPESGDAEIFLRIDDHEKDPAYKDRFSRRFLLAAGENRICVPLETMTVSDMNRRIDLTTIRKILLFKVRPERKFEFYLDYIRLEK